MAELLDLTDMRAVAEHIVAIGVERDRFRSALLEIADHLGAGPCGQTGCRGCEYEYGEAVRISREALGLPYALIALRAVAHDPAEVDSDG